MGSQQERQEEECLLRDTARSAQIAKLNDRLRTSGRGGQIMISRGVDALIGENIAAMLTALAEFDEFDEDNDPYGERDFGLFDFQGAELMWKIDYYGDPELNAGSTDPANPQSTWRVLTILLATEY